MIFYSDTFCRGGLLFTVAIYLSFNDERGFVCNNSYARCRRARDGVQISTVLSGKNKVDLCTCYIAMPQ